MPNYQHPFDHCAMVLGSRNTIIEPALLSSSLTFVPSLLSQDQHVAKIVMNLATYTIAWKSWGALPSAMLPICSKELTKLPYICKQKHVLLFRKSEFLFFKVFNTNMPLFFRNNTFLFLKIESWNFQHFIDLGFQLIRTTFIFCTPCC